jgi:hypothetical protein
MKLTSIASSSSGSSGGFSGRMDTYLCSDGEFLREGYSSVAVYVDGATASSGGRTHLTGRWQVITEGPVAGLELKATNGETSVYQLDRTGSMTYLGGQRVFVTPAERCS